MKQFSSASIIALKDALKHVYWRKRDLRDFIYHNIENKAIIPTLDFQSETKGETVSKLIDRMVNRLDLYEQDLLRLFDSVVNFSDFSHLEKEEDSKTKIANAQKAVAAVRKQAEGYFQKQEAAKRAEERKEVFRKLQAERTELKDRIEGLRGDFYKLLQLDPQPRGYAFEKFLNDLFEFFDLDPRRSFKLVGEQIDGAFTFENLDYLVEAKWQNDLINASDLHSFAGKVSEKFKATLGLYISFNGYSAEALAAGGSNIKSMILMDGEDITAIIESRIELPELLYRKRRYAAETGIIYRKASDIL